MGLDLWSCVPSDVILNASAKVPSFLVSIAKSAVLFAFSLKSSIASANKRTAAVLFAGLKYRLALLPAVAFVLLI